MELFPVAEELELIAVAFVPLALDSVPKAKALLP